MPPQNPYTPPTLPNPVQGQSSKYDFIMDAGNPMKRRGLSGGGSFGKLLLLAVVGLVLIIGIIIYSSLSKGGTDPNIIKIAQEQTEIIRVSQLHNSDLTSPLAKNLAIDAQLTFTSDQKSYMTYLGQHGIKISSKVLGLAQNSQTDSQLNNALTNGSLDVTFAQIIASELQTYQQTIRQVYDTTTSNNSKQELRSLYNDAGLLATQSQQADSSPSPL